MFYLKATYNKEHITWQSSEETVLSVHKLRSWQKPHNIIDCLASNASSTRLLLPSGVYTSCLQYTPPLDQTSSLELGAQGTRPNIPANYFLIYSVSLIGLAEGARLDRQQKPLSFHSVQPQPP